MSAVMKVSDCIGICICVCVCVGGKEFRECKVWKSPWFIIMLLMIWHQALKKKKGNDAEVCSGSVRVRTYVRKNMQLLECQVRPVKNFDSG